MGRRPAVPLATVRRANTEDRPAIEALWREVDRVHARLQPGFFRLAGGSPRTNTFLMDALHDQDEIVLLAIADGAAVGLVHAQIYDTPATPTLKPCRRAHIEDLVVTRSWRRRGLGRQLMAAAASWARANRAQQIVLTVWEGNLAARRFYDALGYRDVSRTLKLDL